MDTFLSGEEMSRERRRKKQERASVPYREPVFDASKPEELAAADFHMALLGRSLLLLDGLNEEEREALIKRLKGEKR